MKICIITPTSHIENFSQYGDMEMCLSHIVLGIDVHAGEKTTTEEARKEWQNKYINYYKNVKKEVILDNSAYEIGKLEQSSASGEGLGAGLVLDAAEIISPTIIICKDVLCNREETFRSTKEFIQEIRNRNLLGRYKLMAVPQGKTKEEWLQSFIELSLLKEIDMLGFSKISVPVSFLGDQKSPQCVTQGRLLCTKAVQDLLEQDFDFYSDVNKQTKYNGPKKVHLLGGDNWLGYELSQQKNYPWIYSNDSSCAVWYGMHDQEFSSDGKMEKIIVEKPDLENYNYTTLQQLESKRAQILHNIAILQKLTK